MIIDNKQLSRTAHRYAAGILILLALTSGCSFEEEWTASGPRHLLLITVDTWRADHFLSDRAGTALTPRLTELASQSIVYSRAFSPSNVTSPGVAAFLTGLLPHRSGVIINKHTLSPEISTLASLLQERGFATGAFVANPVLKPGNGFEKGFDAYELIQRRKPLRKARADAVRFRALEWLDKQHSSSPVFLWVHFMEPHGPYEPPLEDIDLFPLEAFSVSHDIPLREAGNQSGLGAIPSYQQYGQKEPISDGRHYLSRYAAEVRSLDRGVGELLDDLEKRGFLGRSLLIVTADHGEALVDDHGYFFSHGNLLTHDQTAVPLLISYPGCEAGKTRSWPVSTLDVVPTVLELLGFDGEAHLDGRSLLSDRTEPVFGETHTEQTVIQWPWKLRERRQDKLLLLYDLHNDPGEEVNLATSEAALVSRLHALNRRAARLPALAEPLSRKDLSEEDKRALSALGYL